MITAPTPAAASGATAPGHGTQNSSDSAPVGLTIGAIVVVLIIGAFGVRSWWRSRQLDE